MYDVLSSQATIHNSDTLRVYLEIWKMTSWQYKKNYFCTG